MQASRHTVHVSRPTFTPAPGCAYRPIYDLARDFASTLAFDDGDLMRPPMIPADRLDEAFAVGYALIDRALLDTPASEGDSFIALPSDNLYRLGTNDILKQRGSHDELDAANSVLDAAYQAHSECIDPQDEPHFFQAAEQAEAHVDWIAWELLVRYGITPLPSLLLSFLTTDDPSCAARVTA